METALKGQIGEDFVNKLAFGSFLKYWCYPGPLDIAGDCKEICDLLIVFDTTCIIVSVKNFAFKENYERYFNKTVAKATKQIKGAERKLFGKRPVLLRHPDRNDELFPKQEIRDVYRIIVNLSMDVKFYQSSFFEGGKAYGVMDGEAWMDALDALNTIPDFVAYLKARFDFFGLRPAFVFPREEFDFSVNDELAAERVVKEMAGDAGSLIMVNGKEVDLIAYFMVNGFAFPDVGHDVDDGTFLFNIDGQWSRLVNNDVYRQKLELEKDSYFFDQLVHKHVLNTDQGHHLARMLFRFKRLDRARLARAFMEYHDRISARPNVLVNRTTLTFDGVHFLFIWFMDSANLEQLDPFVNLAMLHFHYKRHFKDIEIGALGLSSSKEHVSYGYSKQLKAPTPAELKDMEGRFRTEGWSLNES